MTRRNLLVTGRPGVGKTTLVMNVVEASGLAPRGFYTEEMRADGAREGFKVKTFIGEENILAHVDSSKHITVGKYGVDVQRFESIIVSELDEALQGSGIIVIDEIGKMELYSDAFKELVIRALDSPYPVLGVITERGDGFVQRIKDRADVKMFTVTFENRGALAGEIVREMKGWRSSSRP